MKKQIRIPHVIFDLANQHYAIYSTHVRQMLVLPPVTPLPNQPAWVRGVFHLRGTTYQVYDLRQFLGMPPARSGVDEMLAMLDAREQDHRNWLAELEVCVKENRPFKLARDHHKCKFGLWYDSYKATSQVLGNELRKMDEPHKIIHDTASTVLDLAEAGDTAGALKIIEARRDEELAAMIRLFANVKKIVRNSFREMAVLVEWPGGKGALTVDEVVSVERIPDESIENMPCDTAKKGMRIGRMASTGESVLLMEVPGVLQQAAG